MLSVRSLSTPSGLHQPSPAVLEVYNVYFPGAKSPFPNYVRNFLEADGPIEWVWHNVTVDAFFEHELPSVKAGALLLLDYWMLRPDYITDDIDFAESDDALLRLPLLWPVLNHSEPLLIILHSDGKCDVDWPSTTHHVFYRNVWCDRAHDEWLASQAAEDGAKPGVWPTLRDFPFGTAYDDGALEEVGAERRPLSERRLLLSFRGSITYRKPSRLEFGEFAARRATELDSIAAASMAGVPPHPSGVGRWVVETKGFGPDGDLAVPLEGTYPQADAISYLELLRDSIFAISPPADLWESYRTYEAIEAGSIPVVADNATYHTCGHPALHMLETIPGTVGVASWEELPERLGALMADPVALQRRQDEMLSWLHGYKATTRRQMLETAAAMRAGRWAPRTRCTITPLSPVQVLAQQQALQAYWRKPQGWQDDPWHGGPYMKFGHTSRAFVGDSSRCDFHVGCDSLCTAASKGTYFTDEVCYNPECVPPLIDAITCGPVR